MDKKCPIYQTVQFVGKRWTLLILTELYKRRTKWKRYSQLKKSLPNITPKILSARLKELKHEKMIKKRIDANTFPIKSEYSLTKMGLDFVKIIRDMKEWGLKWEVKNEYCQNVSCKECEL